MFLLGSFVKGRFVASRFIVRRVVVAMDSVFSDLSHRQRSATKSKNACVCALSVSLQRCCHVYITPEAKAGIGERRGTTVVVAESTRRGNAQKRQAQQR